MRNQSTFLHTLAGFLPFSRHNEPPPPETMAQGPTPPMSHAELEHYFRTHRVRGGKRTDPQALTGMAKVEHDRFQVWRAQGKRLRQRVRRLHQHQGATREEIRTAIHDLYAATSL